MIPIGDQILEICRKIDPKCYQWKLPTTISSDRKRFETIGSRKYGWTVRYDGRYVFLLDGADANWPWKELDTTVDDDWEIELFNTLKGLSK